jgi:hypothetical protein
MCPCSPGFILSLPDYEMNGQTISIDGEEPRHMDIFISAVKDE